MPVLPFSIGVVEVRVAKQTLKILNLPMEDLDTPLKQVSEAVRSAVSGSMKDDTYEILEQKKPNLAIAIDFDEEKLGPKKFRRAVELCADAALGVLLKNV